MDEVVPPSSSPDGTPTLLDADFQSLAPQQLKLTRMIGSLVAVVLTLATLCAAIFYYLVVGRSATELLLVGGASAIVIAGSIWLGWIFPGLAYRRSHWRLDQRGLEIHRGVWWRHQIIVPVSRVQHSDIEQGPLQRSYDVATLIVHTAGTKDSSVELEGISHATAERLRDKLVAQCEVNDQDQKRRTGGLDAQAIAPESGTLEQAGDREISRDGDVVTAIVVDDDTKSSS